MMVMTVMIEGLLGSYLSAFISDILGILLLVFCTHCRYCNKNISSYFSLSALSLCSCQISVFSMLSVPRL